MTEMENNCKKDDFSDQGGDFKGFAFRKNQLSRGDIIEGDFSNSICFREALKVFSEDNINIGQLSVSIDKEKDSDKTTYVIFVSLTEYIERFKHTSTVFGRVTHDFRTIEERRSDCLQLGKKKIERNVTLLNEGDEYCVSLSFFDGKDWERDSFEITKEDSLILMGEAANYLYVRYLAQSGRCTAINFLSLLCDGSLHMSRYVSSPIGASKIGREKREVCTMCVKRMLLNPRGKITAEWVLTKGAGYILEEKREVPYGSVTHPMMRYCSGNNTPNEGDDINEDEWLNILSMELSEEKRNCTTKEDKPLKGDAGKDQLAETFGNSETHGKTEETQAMGYVEEPNPGNEKPTLDKDPIDHEGTLRSVGSELFEEIISKVSINSDDAFQKRKINNQTLPEGIAEEQEEARSNDDENGSRRSSRSDETKAKYSPEVYENENQSGEEAARDQDEDERSTETDPTDEEKESRDSENLSKESSEVTVRALSESKKKMEEEENEKRMKYENYQWPDVSHLEEEIEGVVVRAMDGILSDYKKVRRENAKLRLRMRNMSLEEEKLRRKMRGRDRKPHWKLADGVRLMTIHKKSSVTSDGRVDQRLIPLVCRWRDDQQLQSVYRDRKVANRRRKSDS